MFLAIRQPAKALLVSRTGLALRAADRVAARDADQILGVPAIVQFAGLGPSSPFNRALRITPAIPSTSAAWVVSRNLTIPTGGRFH